MGNVRKLGANRDNVQLYMYCKIPNLVEVSKELENINHKFLLERR